MLSKKEGLILAVAAIGGVGLALTLAGGNDKEEADEREKQMKKEQLMLRYEAPVYAPSEIYAPYEENVVTRIVHNILASPEPGQAPVSTETVTPGVSTGSKKTYKSAGMALGYEGYVTPSKPSPVSPGYIPGVTKFVQYKEPAYIPSPVAPPYVAKRGGSGGGTTSKAPASKKSTYVRRSKTGYTYRGGKLVSK